jgi:ABC-type Zn uptake system ZnuABC Zn-binding protein ZnuA
MQAIKQHPALLWALIIGIGITFSLPAQSARGQEKPIHILCSTFPSYQITRNVTKGRTAAQVELMIPAQLGCPHDYALTPQDMRALAQADLLVINGLGLEEFIGPSIKQANPRLAIIDSSIGVTETLDFADGPGPGHDDHEAHEHQGTNPHLFVSPRLVAQITMTIANGLAKFDPEGSELYRKNGEAYALGMTKLGQELAALGPHLKIRKILTQHGVFDYLARDLGLRVVAVVQAHAGQQPSAAEMLALIKTAQENKAGAIFSEPQYPVQVVETIAKEAGINSATLNPVATGPENAPLDYYEKTMRTNLATLKSTLGTE